MKTNLNKEMKKIIAIVLVVAMVAVGAVVALAGSNSNQGVPSAKATASWDSTDYDPSPGDWVDVPFGTEGVAIKTSEPADLIISFTAEGALATDVKIKGTGEITESTSKAKIEVQALVGTDINKDGDYDDDGEWATAEPGEVVFAYRLMTLKGLLWSPAQVGMITLPEQWIEIYKETRAAHSFNFVLKNVGSGVHPVKIQVKTEKIAGFEGGTVTTVIGKRTLLVESVRMVND